MPGVPGAVSWAEPDTGLEPFQPSDPLPPEAVQARTPLLEDQVSVNRPPGATVAGEGALNVTAGAVPPELLPLELLLPELLLELLLELLPPELLLPPLSLSLQPASRMPNPSSESGRIRRTVSKPNLRFMNCSPGQYTP